MDITITEGNVHVWMPDWSDKVLGEGYPVYPEVRIDGRTDRLKARVEVADGIATVSFHGDADLIDTLCWEYALMVKGNNPAADVAIDIARRVRAVVRSQDYLDHQKRASNDKNNLQGQSPHRRRVDPAHHDRAVP